MNIAVLVSGGVDSSVALKLLRDQGHKVTAFYLKIWLEDELSFLGNCPWEEDLSYVQAVCAQLDVPLEVISLQKEYWEQVVSYTISQVKMGNTPNPDILCNQRIKFGAFFSKIDGSFDKVATGHYAQVHEENGVFVLSRAPDPIKDQSYFLSHLSQEQLGRALFPIGHLQKNEVRALAQEFDLPNKTRKDSQGICFLGTLDFAAFLRHHLGEKEGTLVELETGKIVGTHKGFWFYTIGQRQGLGLAGGPWYVADKDPEKNIVFISKNYHSAEKERNSFYVGDCHWISGRDPEQKEFLVKMRHGAQIYKACVDYNREKKSAFVQLEGRDQGIAPGQFAVFYDDAVCIGSGTITKNASGDAL
ncbi:MAG TPA: tRNA 2-thiouridine(34) synthase MnmA [Candidatus Babeliales bacterium]|nr:tRNA 2-thiouridine(34) synthase MnmA [Candidatus Babeliales bacterium]